MYMQNGDKWNRSKKGKVPKHLPPGPFNLNLITIAGRNPRLNL